MDLSILKILSDTKKLVSKLKDCETTSNNLIAKANSINQENEAMKQYNDDLNKLGNVSINQPRNTLLNNIYCEIKKLKELENENSFLKKELSEYQMTLDIIMTKYRQQISQLITLNQNNKVEFPNYLSNLQMQTIADQEDKICKLMTVIRKLFDLDIDSIFNFKKDLDRLMIENQNLRELLGISKNYESNVSTGKVEIGVQTDDLNEEYCLNEDTESVQNDDKHLLTIKKNQKS